MPYGNATWRAWINHGRINHGQINRGRERVMQSKTFGVLAAICLLAGCSAPDEPLPGRRSGGGGSSASAIFRGNPLAAGSDTIFFDADRAVIRDDARETLDRQAEWLQGNNAVNVQIAGSSDERATTEYSLALGNRRAYAAYTYLQVKGVPSGRMTTISFGKDNPIASGSSEDSWSRNRNAVTSAR